MKVFITARFKDADRQNIEQLCAIVKAVGCIDFSFIRDVENYQKVFDDPAELWKRARQEIVKCDALLIDVTDAPSGGRVIEAGIAFGLRKPIIVLVKEDAEYKGFFDGIAIKVIRYKSFQDAQTQLAMLVKSLRV